MGFGIIESGFGCRGCHEWIETTMQGPYKACEAIYRTSPIWKSLCAKRGFGGVGKKAAATLYHERKLRELKQS